MGNENPGAYNEARERIREKQEKEKITLEKKKEEFEISKEKFSQKKRLDILSLQRGIETGKNLSILKSEIKEFLDSGDISIDTYTNVLNAIEKQESDSINDQNNIITPDFIFDPKVFPGSQSEISIFFEKQKLGDNLFIDLAGFFYGVAQGSVLLMYLFWKIIFDTLLLPRDLYKYFRS